MNAPDAMLRPRSYFWRTDEDRILRELYAQPGGPALIAERTGRTIGAVHARAQKLGVRGVRHIPEPFHRRRYPAEPWIDIEIERVYRSTPTRGAIRDLARRLMRPRWWVTKRAENLGLAVPRFKEPPWSPAEDELLRSLAHHLPAVIAQKFRQRGFKRTATAIAVRRKRLNLDIRDPDHWTARQLGLLLGVDGKTVTRWIEREGLPARRRGTARCAAQGGDQWWISRADLRRWIHSHAQLIDLRKVDRFWFIDLAFG